MFGYIRPQKSELLVREFGEYGGVYCSLCRRLGRDYGPAARLALNYDATFYALLLLACSAGEKPEFTSGRCVVNPLKRCLYCCDSGTELSKAAALTMFLAYYKAKDDVEDSSFLRGLRSRFLLLFLGPAAKKAARRFPEISGIVSKAMEQQKMTEKQKAPGFDQCADPTGTMLAELFAQASGRPETADGQVLRETGYSLGRWVYFMDAADDLKKDIRRHSFNPFAVRFGLGPESTPQELEQAKKCAEETLNGTLARLSESASLMKNGNFSPILRNIIFLGLPAMQKKCLSEGKEDCGHVRSL